MTSNAFEIIISVYLLGGWQMWRYFRGLDILHGFNRTAYLLVVMFDYR